MTDTDLMNGDVRELVERQAIVDVLHRYCYLFDTQQLDELVEQVFAEEGSDDHGGGPVQGRPALREWFGQAATNIASSLHTVSNIIVDRDGEGATMRSSCVSWTWTRESEHLGPLRPADYVVTGYYVDQLRRYAEGWRIDRRVLESNGQSIVGVGTIPPTQSGLHALAARMAR